MDIFLDKIYVCTKKDYGYETSHTTYQCDLVENMNTNL